MSEESPPTAAARPLDVASHAPRRGMRTPLAGFGIVFGRGLREPLRPKRLLAAVAITLLLAGGAAYAAGEEARRGWSGGVEYELWQAFDLQILQVLVPLIALIFVGPAYSRELRQRTMVYHLVRPVSRSTVFLARYTAGVVPAAVCGTLLYLAIVSFTEVQLPGVVWTALPLTAVAGAVVLGAIYCVLGTIFERGLVAGLLYTFVVEVVVAGLPGAIQKLSVRFHLRSIYHGFVDAPFAEVSDRVAHRIAAPERSSSSELIDAVPLESPATALLTLACVAAVALLVGVLHVRRRDFALKD